MQKMPLSIIFYCRKPGKQALSVIAGALQKDPRLAALKPEFPNSLSQLQLTIAHAKETANKVLVCWSFYSPQFPEIIEQLRIIQEAFTNITHLAGGVHASAEPEKTLSAGFDYVAVGEGEKIILDFVAALLDEKSLTQIKGIACFHEGKFVKNGKGDAVQLDDYPAFDARHHKYGPIEITRGCVYACHFCQTPFINKARFRHRSIDNIIMHVRQMHDYGLRDYRFISPTALSYGSQNTDVNADAIEKLLSAIRETIDSGKRIFFGTFPSEVRPEHVSPSILRILKRYVDNNNLIIGGQSGSQSMLDRTHRGHTVEAIETAVAYCVEAGFTPNVDFLFGMPGESPEDARLTREFARRLTDKGARIHSHVFMPLPGTPLKNSPPGRVEESTAQQLFQLEAAGKAYGPWKMHERIAQQLAQRVRAESKQ